MALRPIVMFPDPRLRQPASPVTSFDAALRDLAGDLLDTMRAASGIGITAPHIGVLSRLIVIAPDPAGEVRIYVNPQIVWSSPEAAVQEEGSISMPGVTDPVRRAARIRVACQDLTGAAHHDEADGLLAVCLQHEIDQLDGIFWIHRLSRLRRDRLIKRYEKMQRSSLR